MYRLQYFGLRKASLFPPIFYLPITIFLKANWKEFLERINNYVGTPTQQIIILLKANFNNFFRPTPLRPILTLLLSRQTKKTQ